MCVCVCVFVCKQVCTLMPVLSLAYIYCWELSQKTLRGFLYTKCFVQKELVLQYQLHNRVENLADVSTRCSGLLQGEDEPYHIFALKKTRASGRNVGKVFNPVVKLVLENQPFLMPEPAEKPSLQCFVLQI